MTVQNDRSGNLTYPFFLWISLSIQKRVFQYHALGQEEGESGASSLIMNKPSSFPSFL